MNLPVRHNIGAFPSYMWKSEATIINRLISEILQRGLLISVYDGEEWAVKKSSDRAEIQRNTAATDETYFRVCKADDTTVGTITLIHGNWSEVISDHTDNETMGSIMKAIEPTVNRMEGVQ